MAEEFSERQHNSKWLEHWSVSGSVIIAAICLGRDAWRDIGDFYNSSFCLYMLESLLLVIAVVLLAFLAKDMSFWNEHMPLYFENVFKDTMIEVNNSYCMSEKETQTKHRDYHKSIERLKSHHHVQVTRVNKDIRQLRKYCADKIKKLKSEVKEVTKVMSSIQLKVPSLVKEHRFLIDEKETIDTEIAQEMAKQNDLQDKFLSLHSYMHGYGRASLTETIPDLIQ